MRACILRGCVTMAAGAENFITQAFARRVLPVPAGADPEMQFLHLDDYTAIVETALTRRANGIFNIAGQRHAAVERPGSNGRGYGPAAASADPQGVDWPDLAPGVAELLETGRTELHPVPLAGVDGKGPK